jgi:hypothetical protein
VHLYPGDRARTRSTRSRSLWATFGLSLLCMLAATQGASAAALPDGRAYELVNPPGLDLGPIVRVPSVSDDGDHVAYMTMVAGDGAIGAALTSNSVAERTPSGWAITDANATATRGYQGIASATPVQFSTDYRKAIIFTSLPLDPDDWDGAGYDLYRLDVGLGTTSWQTFGTTLPDGDGNVAPLLGASSDLARVVFTHQSALLPGVATGSVYVRDAGGLALASVLPDGTPAAGPALVANAWDRGIVGVVGFGSRAPHGGMHPVSDDATRVFFYDVNGSVQGLYERLDASSDTATTVAVSASERAGDIGAASHVLQFVGATHDGAVAYFNSIDQLTDAATPGGGIYRFELGAPVGHRLTQITPDNGDPAGGLAPGTILSDDGTHLYFTSARPLTADAVAGVTNIYVWDGDANDGHEAIYEYDAVTGHVACVSCRPDGGLSEGDASLANFPPATPPEWITQPRNITDDGTVFFVSDDRIVTADQTSATDVYEYRDGRVSLLTSGQGDQDAYIADNSDDGRDVFLLSASPLVPQDRDPGELDLYDARVGGGVAFPAQDGTPACRDDDCQDAPGAAPQVPAPGSTRATDAGDLPAAKPPTKRLSIAKLGSQQRSQLARTGKVTLSVLVTGGGTVTVTGRGRIGAAGTKSLGSVKKVVDGRGATSVRLAFKLSAAARRELARRGRLGITFEGRLGGLSTTARATANLTRVQR